MGDVDQLQGYFGPRDPLEPPKRETPLEPDAFKKILKVQEGEESQKRNPKRGKQVEEEEEPDEKQTTNTPPEATVEFQEYMKKEKEGVNPFAEQGTAPMRRTATEGPNLVEEGKGKKVLGAGTPGQAVSADEEARFTAGLPQAAAPPQETPSESPPPTYPSEAPALPPPEPPSPEAGAPAPEAPEYMQPPPAIQPKTETQQQQQKEKEEKATEVTRKVIKKEPKTLAKVKAYVPSEEPSAQEDAEKSMSLEEKEAFFSQFSPKGQEAKSSEEKENIDQIALGPAQAPAETIIQKEAEQILVSKDEQKKQQQDFNLQSGSGAPTTGLFDMPIPPPISAAPAYTNLSPQMFEFFERMVGIMTIEQFSGVKTVTVSINKPGSVFNQSQIILEHYDTAPNAFNVTLTGSPEALNYFNANVSDLVAALKQSELSFEINVKTPVLLKKYRAVSKVSKTKTKKEMKTEKKQVKGRK